MVCMVWERLPSSYDAVASEYEATFLDELDGKPQDQAMLRDFIESTSDPIADLGCGPGQVGRFVRSHGRTVVGVDISPEMARLASRRLDAALVSDIRQLPFVGASLGGVVAFYSLIHIPREDLDVALAEIHRVLRPGGQLLLSAHEGQGLVEQQDFLGHAVPFVATLFSLDELMDAIRRSGLHLTMSQRREPLESEHQTGRLYIAAESPSLAAQEL
jgi:ubiquinone/menaquinone biosynthesis C-methylase UbiE